MARIYSSSFFHYTTRKGLLGILKEGFKASYCKEQFKDNNGNITYIGIPMISFCDIPLSLISQIVYGDRGYAIGMKREWGIEKSLVPVFYYSNNEKSMITKSISLSCSKLYNSMQPYRKTSFRYKMLGMSKPNKKYDDKDYEKDKRQL